MGHETHRIGREPGGAPSACRGVGQGRPRDSRDRPACWGIARSRASLDARLEEGRRWRAGCQAHAGPAQEVDRPAAREAPGAPSRRSGRQRLSQRALDVEADCDLDSPGVRCPLSPEPSVPCPSIVWVELSGARAPGDSARRGRHRALEALPMAGYKKKREDLAPTSPSSMRAASC